MRELVSVIIPTYNNEKSIAWAIESVLEQTYENVEIIVINDGSTDGTADVCKSFGDKIRYIYQENKGVSAARNYGIREANGEWIGFLDADDWYLPNKCNDCMSALNVFSDAVAVTGANLELFRPYRWRPRKFCKSWPLIKNWDAYDKCTPIDLRDFKSSEIFERREMFSFLTGRRWEPYLHTNSVLIKKRVLLETNGFREDWKIGEDLDLWFRIAAQFGWVFADIPVAVYNHASDTSVTQSASTCEKGIHYIWSNSDVEKNISDPNMQVAYKYFRQWYIRNKIKEGFAVRNRGYVKECLIRMLPPPLSFRFVSSATWFCLPSFIWWLGRFLFRCVRIVFWRIFYEKNNYIRNV